MKRTYSHIDLDERRKIALWRMTGLSVEIIAEKLGRHRSTIFREIKRNTFIDNDVPDLKGYYCVTAHDIACDRRAKLRKLARFSDVRQSVIDRIVHGWSPQQIAGRMRLERHPISVSHETIYKFAYSPDGHAIKLCRPPLTILNQTETRLQTSATTSANIERTFTANVLSVSLSIACMDATGSIALTMTSPPLTDRMITFHGSTAPILGSIFIASRAMRGLQAQYQVIVNVGIDLFLHRRFDVNLSQHAEAVLGEDCFRPIANFIESGARYRAVERVRHGRAPVVNPQTYSPNVRSPSMTLINGLFFGDM